MNSQRIIIVGASSGIGRELAKRYIAANHKVGVTGRRAALLEELQALNPENVRLKAFDVSANDAVGALTELIAELGGLDLLILSAGVGALNPQLVWPLAQPTIATNVTGFTRVVDFGFTFFKNQGSGHLAAITSIAANRGDRGAPAYNASKAYQASYLEGLRKKAVKERLNLTITDLQPGFVATAMAQGDGLFWVAPAAKAAQQIQLAITSRRRKAYITKRWWFAAQLLKFLPAALWEHL